MDLHFLNEGYFRESYFKKNLIIALPKYLSCQKLIGVEPPVFLMLTVQNVKDFVFVTDQSAHIGSNRFENKDLFFPEIRIDTFEADPAATLKPLFDILWNAAGQPSSIGAHDE